MTGINPFTPNRSPDSRSIDALIASGCTFGIALSLFALFATLHAG